MASRIHGSVFLISRPALDEGRLSAYLDLIGAPEWTTDATSDGEKLVEVMGRLCYRSWAPGLNPNVTRVRQGNANYLSNIIAQKHGSVLEHAQYTFIFANVSRLFTHELVRHRVGCAISQESLRYVRLSNGIKYWVPKALEGNEAGITLITETMDHLEAVQVRLAELYDIDNIQDFALKKKLTSAFRRVAPIGLATHIGWSANLRTIRAVLEQRTSRHAEEEIRAVFSMVGRIMRVETPSAFADYEVEEIDGFDEYTTESPKI